MSLEKISLLCSLLVATSTAMVKHHADGSMSSNSGPVNVLQRFLFGQQNHRRHSRASYYINSQPSSLTQNTYGAMTYDQINLMVNEHNKYRRLVQSTNMQTLRWDEELARSAQAHASQCVFQHTSSAVRNFGENLWASPVSNPGTAVALWFNEVYDSQCGCFNGFKECCGHYSQIVWAETNKVGCGLAYCGNVGNAPGQHYLLVCHYNPAGNVLQITADGSVASYPAFNYKTDASCSECPAGSYCNNGLCDVK